MRRTMAIVVALVFAVLGTFLLVRYVQGAEDRALEGEELVEVLVVDSPIAAGTRPEEMVTRLQVEQIPLKVAVVDAISDLTVLEGFVAAIDLIPGEQLSAARFISEEDYLAALAEAIPIDVPTDKLQVTLSLSPERVIGGELLPGNQVAVFASFEPFQLNAVEPTGGEEVPVIVVPAPEEEVTDEEQGPSTGLRTPTTTGIILQKVLVTNIQAEQLPQEIPEERVDEVTTDLAPTGNLLVTLALDPAEAERVVFTAEHGTLWLALEGADVADTITEIVTRSNVYEAP